MTFEDQVQAYLDEHPDDEQHRLTLADLLEARGKLDLARCQRWLAERHLWPDPDLEAFGMTGWHWWSCPDRPHKRRAHAVLPQEVQDLLPRTEWIYDTRREAEQALARALTQLASPPQDQTSGKQS
jgi:hypothetical protein